MTSQPVIKTRGLCRDFGKRHALLNVDLDIPAGTVVGVLGPNGSGKTTLFKHIIGMLIPTRGRVETFGTCADRLDAAQVARIGYVSQQNELPDWLTVGEAIDFYRAHYPAWDRELCRRLRGELSLDEGQGIGGMSTGQKQRLSILLGVCHRPELLLLDEPAASLDPVVRQDFLDLLMELILEPGRTILISSHILTDVQKVIDKVLIINEGQVHCHQDLDDLREQYYRITLNSLDGELPRTLNLTGLVQLERGGHSAVATVCNGNAVQVQQEIDQLGCQADLHRLDFEEIYRLIVTGK